jgi:NADH:ubiquinone oxidoreductase subunit
LWIHHTIDTIPGEKEIKRYVWQKKYLPNQTGSKNSYKPTKIKKNGNKKKYETWK